MLGSGSGASQAGEVGFTEAGAWEAAAGSATGWQDFESFPTSSMQRGANTFGGLTVSISHESVSSADVRIGGPNGSRFAWTYLRGSSLSSMTWTFDRAVNAFSADFFSVSSGDGLVAWVNGTAFDLGTLGVRDGFFGVVSDSAFSSVTFTLARPTRVGEGWGADNVRWSAVPGPGVLGVCGVMGLVASRRRRA
jgi:hypothetical protein